MYEAELICIYDKAFSKLQIPVEIRINNRKVLEDMVKVIGHEDKFMDITIILDKIDKIGWQGLEKAFELLNLSKSEIGEIKKFTEITGIEELGQWFSDNNIESEGLAEINEVFEFLNDHQFENTVKFDPVLARGLNYYTGCIFEVKALDANIGSLGDMLN